MKASLSQHQLVGKQTLSRIIVTDCKQNATRALQESLSQIAHSRVLKPLRHSRFSSTNLTRKSMLLLPGDREIDRIILPKQIYQFIALRAEDLWRGFRVYLTYEGTVQKSVISINNHRIEVQKQQIKHCFPLPQTCSKTVYVKVILDTRCKEDLRIQVECQTGKIKKSSVATQNIEGEFVTIDPYLLIQQSNQLRRKKFLGTESHKSTWDLRPSLKLNNIKKVLLENAPSKPTTKILPIVVDSVPKSPGNNVPGNNTTPKHNATRSFNNCFWKQSSCKLVKSRYVGAPLSTKNSNRPTPDLDSSIISIKTTVEHFQKTNINRFLRNKQKPSGGNLGVQPGLLAYSRIQ